MLTHLWFCSFFVLFAGPGVRGDDWASFDTSVSATPEEDELLGIHECANPGSSSGLGVLLNHTLIYTDALLSNLTHVSKLLRDTEELTEGIRATRGLNDYLTGEQGKIEELKRRSTELYAALPSLAVGLLVAEVTLLLSGVWSGDLWQTAFALHVISFYSPWGHNRLF